MAMREALSAYDAVYLELNASTTMLTTSQSPAASASWKTVHPARLRDAGFAPAASRAATRAASHSWAA